MKILLALVLVILLAACSIFMLVYIEQPDIYFQEYSKDLHNGLWVPDIFPHDISAIHEQHDLDTNQVWLKFTIGHKPVDLTNFTLVQGNEVKLSSPRFANWWPNSLSSGYSFYQGTCTGGNVSALAISTSSKVAYWWC